MTSLTCMAIGDRKVVGVDIEALETVADLKDMIKAKLPSLDHRDASALTLYHAKNGGNWLNSSELYVAKLGKGELPENMDGVLNTENEMRPACRIDATAFNVPDDNDGGSRDVEVLMAVPGQPTKRPEKKEPFATRKRSWDEMNNILDDQTVPTNNDAESAIDISTEAFNDVEKVQPAVQVEQPKEIIGDDKIDLVHSYIVAAINAFGDFKTTSEPSRMHVIAPVLICVCALFGGRATLRVNDSVAKQRAHADGTFELEIRRGRKRVCLFEVKDDSPSQRLAQGPAGSDVVSGAKGATIVSHVVTNFDIWHLFTIKNDQVQCDRTRMAYEEDFVRAERDFAPSTLGYDIPTRDSVKAIAEKIHALLADDDD